MADTAKHHVSRILPQLLSSPQHPLSAAPSISKGVEEGDHSLHNSWTHRTREEGVSAGVALL